MRQANTNSPQDPMAFFTGGGASKAKNPVNLKATLYKYIIYWPYFLLSVVFFVGASYLISKTLTPVYRVNASLFIGDEKQNMASEILDKSVMGFQSNNIENDMFVLKSFSMANEALKRLDFNVSYYREAFFSKQMIYGNTPILVDMAWNGPQITGGMLRVQVLDEQTFEMSIEEDGFAIYNPIDPFYKTGLRNTEPLTGKFTFGEPIKSETFNFTIKNAGALPGDVIFFTPMDTPSLALHYAGAVSAFPAERASSVITLSLQTPVRKMGEEYLNALMDAYIDFELREKNRFSERTVEFINNQLLGITDSLSFFENRLQNFRKQNRVFNLQDEGTKVIDNLFEIENEKAREQIALRYYQDILTYIERDDLDALVIPSVAGVQDALLNTLVTSLIEIQGEKIRVSAIYADGSKPVLDVNRKLESTKRSLTENLRSSIRNSQSLLSQYEDRIRGINTSINALPETERNLIGLERQFNINEGIYMFLMEKRSEAEIARAANSPKNFVVDAARAGGMPVFPNKKVNYLAGLLAGLIIPALVLYGKFALNTKISDLNDFRNSMMDVAPVIAEIPEAKNKHLPVLNNPKSVVAETYRSIRSDMSFLVPNQEQVTVLFTSTVGGEGKTFSSINLAAAYSLLRKKTIIIGLDLRKPKIFDDFKLKNTKGVTNVLTTDMDWKTVVSPSGYDYLDIMLSGPVPPNPAELLQFPKFKEMMAAIKKEYDVVILDTPPVGLVSETKEIAKYADVCFYVFRYDYSEKNALLTVETFKELIGKTPLYSILNAVPQKAAYGYGYGSNGYGYYEEESPSKKKKA
ncbi:MAG: GumC family protein [Nitritalea sp.]